VVTITIGVIDMCVSASVCHECVLVPMPVPMPVPGSVIFLLECLMCAACVTCLEGLPVCMSVCVWTEEGGANEE
jgi:hypothetical protein